MAKNVLILGAGASRPFGAPVMGDFLDVAQSIFAAGASGHHSKSFANVFHAISCLQAVHSKSEFDLVNLESVFTAFELAKLLQRLPGLDPAQIDSLVDDLKRVIVETLEQRISFPVSGRTIGSHPDYRNFFTAIRGQENHSVDSLAILTFNYDIIVDMACWETGIGIDYALACEPGAHRPMPLLKLHGSLNWGAETQTGKVAPWFMRSYLKTHNLNQVAYPSRGVRIPIGGKIHELAHSGGHPNQIDPLPVLVPPSWNKADSHKSIAGVWTRAAKELAEADSIFIVGYSLPNTDSFFRQLYAIGTVGDIPLKRFFVYDIDPSREQVFRDLLGPGARPRFKFHHVGLVDALPAIAAAITGR